MREENNKLFVGNLSYNITDDQLFDLFNSQEGLEVTDSKVIIDRMTGKPRGFGFVTLKSGEMANKAIELMNNKEVDGRNIIVNISRPQTDSDNRFQGGNRGGYQKQSGSRRY
ncbi:MAG: RNA-binding protein [Candidatus Berkelbacteria bacterium]|nr:RNA-binding protein [Candidatus Berkelbacteria bacterium]